MLKIGSSGEDVKKLQKKLVLLGFYINPDGKFGPVTESAIKQIQKKYKIKSDGIAGPKTEEAISYYLKKITSDNFSMSGLSPINPDSHPGLYSYTPGPNSGPKDRGKWIDKSVKSKLIQIGSKAKAIGVDIGVGDISLRHGGPFYSVVNGKDLVHRTHQSGKDIDIRPIRKDRRKSPVSVGQSSYDREMTEKIALLFRDAGPRLIYFNDPELIKKYSYIFNCPGHSNHLHIVF